VSIFQSLPCKHFISIPLFTAQQPSPWFHTHGSIYDSTPSHRPSRRGPNPSFPRPGILQTDHLPRRSAPRCFRTRGRERQESQRAPHGRKTSTTTALPSPCCSDAGRMLLPLRRGCLCCTRACMRSTGRELKMRML
jgi:hypothetical protein